jgi:hypothetical protein
MWNAEQVLVNACIRSARVKKPSSIGNGNHGEKTYSRDTNEDNFLVRPTRGGDFARETTLNLKFESSWGVSIDYRLKQTSGKSGVEHHRICLEVRRSRKARRRRTEEINSRQPDRSALPRKECS